MALSLWGDDAKRTLARQLQNHPIFHLELES